MMKPKHLIFFCTLCLIGTILKAQQHIHGKNFNLNSPVLDNNSWYHAREYVRLKEGARVESLHSSSRSFRMLTGNELVKNYSPNNNGSSMPQPASLPHSKDYVGFVPTSFSVSNTGQANYNIPIEVPPGPNGMQPQLSIFYNGTRADGLLGIGFSLSGLSAITRTGQSKYYDGQNKPITYVEDRWLLNGQRLLLKSGSHGESDAVYQLENNNKMNIAVAGLNEYDAPKEMKVTSADGSTMTYGGDDAVGGVGTSIINAMFLKTAKDKWGNQIEYTYKEIGQNEKVIDKIHYGGNSNAEQPHNNYIEFHYDKRPMRVINFLSGRMEQKAILREIRVFSYGSLYRTYKLNYHRGADMPVNRIYKVEIWNAGGEKYPDIDFKWPEFGNNVMVDDVNNIAFEDRLHKNLQYNFHLIDRNRDGIKDFLTIPKVNGEGSYPNLRYYFTKSNKDGGYIDLISNDVLGNFHHFFKGWNEKNFFGKTKINVPNNTALKKFFFKDYNNDGIEDLTIFDFSQNVTPHEGYQILISEDGSFEKMENREYYTNPGSLFWLESGDFDLDGKTDELLFELWYEDLGVIYKYERVEVNCSGGFRENVYFNNRGWLKVGAEIKHYFAGDFNGNGFKEFVFVSENPNHPVVHFELNPTLGNIIDFSQNNGRVSALGLEMSTNIKVADFNGDGFIDILIFYDGGKKMYLNNGSGIFSQASSTEFGGLENIPNADGNSREGIKLLKNSTFNNDFHLGDFDGNGFIDILAAERIKENSTQKLKIVIHYNFGNGFHAGTSYFLDNLIETNNNIPEMKSTVDFIVTDYDGDMKDEVILQYPYAAEPNYTQIGIYKREFWNFGEPQNNNSETFSSPYLVSEIHEKKQTHYLAYKPSFQNYHSNTKALPNEHFFRGEPNYFPVRCHTIKDPVSDEEIYLEKFEFEKPIVHYEKGFLGFKEIYRSALTKNDKYLATVTQFGIVDKNHATGRTLLLPEYRYEKLSHATESGMGDALTDPDVTTQYSYDFDFTRPVTHQYMATRNTTRVTNHLTGIINETEQKYDDNGNLKWAKNKVNTAGGTTLKVVQRTDYKNFYAPTDIWTELLLPRKVEVQYCEDCDNQIDETRETTYNYNSNGSLKFTKEYTHLTDAKDHILTTYNNYDDFGNATDVSVRHYVTAPYGGKTSRTNRTVTEYDATGRFVTKETNTLGHSISTEWNHVLGVPLQSTNANGLITRYEYNTNGRLLRTINPDNTIQKLVTQWAFNDYTYFTSRPIIKTTTTGTATPAQTVWTDTRGNTVATQTQNFGDGKWTYTAAWYNEFGNLKKKFLPSPSNSFTISSPHIHYTYNERHQMQREKSGPVQYLDRTYTHYFNERKVTVTDNKTGLQKETVQNYLGQTQTVTDIHAAIQATIGQVSYLYNVLGQQETITPPSGEAVTVGFDEHDHQQLLVDPDAGTMSYTYSPAGELEIQTDGQHEQKMFYDDLGRFTLKESPEGNYTYTYDRDPNNLGKLNEVNAPGGHKEKYTYDDMGRLTTVQETIDGRLFETTTRYNGIGQPTFTTHPSGITLAYEYDNQGFLQKIMYGNKTLWELQKQETTVDGYITQYRQGSYVTTRNFTREGFPNEFYTEWGNNKISHWVYDFEGATGNLVSRENKLTSSSFFKERFEYDELDRLEKVYRNNTTQSPVLTMTYGSTGNIEAKSDVAAEYIYEGIQPHAVSQLKQVVSSAAAYVPQNVTYTGFYQPQTISEGANNATFMYGHDQQRRKMTLNQTETYYLGSEELTINELGQETWTRYITAAGQLVAIIQITDGSEKVYYTLTDYLGSITMLLNEDGTMHEERSYDAWGRLRNPDNWLSYEVGELSVTNRGYTFHEHLTEFSLINMNGRLYDPLLGRMLSPDNHVQSPANTQNYNRYSYVLNNPMKYTDPDGEIAFLAVVGIYAGVNLAADLIRNEGKMNIGEIGMSVGLGAVQGALAATGVGAAATGWTVLGSAVASQINIPIYQSDNFNLSVSPSLFAGTNGLRVGASLYGSARFGNTSVGFGYNLGRNFGATDLSGQMAEAKWSSITSWNVGWNDGKHGLSYGASYFSGNYSQSVGNFGFQIGDFSGNIENDFLSGSGDKYRSAAANFSYRINNDLSITSGFNLFTSAPTGEVPGGYEVNGRNRRLHTENSPILRNGVAYGGITYKGNSYRVGRNSESIRSGIQNGWHNIMPYVFLRQDKTNVHHFKEMNYPASNYTSFGTVNPFTTY